MKYRKLILGICLALPLLLVAGILWRASEQQYVAMTNLGLRLRVLQESALNDGQLGQENRLSWVMAWKPLTTAMQFEARQALSGRRGIHLSRPMHEQLSQFSEGNIESEADLKAMLSRLKFSDEMIESNAPIVFSRNEQLSSSSSVARFRKEMAGVLSREAAYSNWLSPILRQQHSQDRSVICKTQVEIEAFQAFSDKLQSRCASTKNKWAACNGKSEPVARHMKELQMSLEADLEKFKSRWSFKDVGSLCSDS